MFDAYSRRARLAPAALVAAPAIVLAGGSLAALEQDGTILGFLLAAAMLVLCGLVRSRGRDVEPGLWRQWGGPPTTRRLRWSGPTPEPSQQRRHGLIEGILGESLPSRAEEAADPQDADRRYETAVATLRDLTRRREDFPLVAEENADYGFRRNTYGLKPLGLAIAVATGAAAASLAVINHAPAHFLPIAAVSAVALVAWLLVVRPGWVCAAADRYAERLIETCESLHRQSTENRPASPVTNQKEAADG